jgi:hypothetical protein
MAEVDAHGGSRQGTNEDGARAIRMMSMKPRLAVGQSLTTGTVYYILHI